MKTTVSVTQAQAKLPRLLHADRITGVMRHTELAGYIVPRERFEALIETMETLANPEAMEALRKFAAGNTKFASLAEVKRQMRRK
jgi:PHD/YefM family antitoxin component YafN of YafNO toxin-antitoxin module